MEFPITVESQDAFDALVKGRLDREKTKHDTLQQQLDALTAEKQALETKANAFETRATTAETKLADKDAAEEHATLVNDIAGEFGITADILRGTTEDELRAHAEALKPLISTPGKRLPDPGKTPEPKPASEEREAVRQLFGSD